MTTSARGGRATDAVVGPFRGFRDPEIYADDGLVLAWPQVPWCSVHAGESTICLLEGTLYEIDGLRVATSTTPPARLVADAYARDGEAVLQRLRGGFWLLLWNRRELAGIIATDQMGERCPSWARTEGDIAFASDVPELLALLPSRPGPDPLAVAHWLAVTDPPEGRSLFAGVRRVKGGHVLPIGRSRCEPRRYWNLHYGPLVRAPQEELVERLRTALERSIDRRLGDAPGPAVLLSGGLDSSVVATLAARSVRRSDPGAERSTLASYSAVFPAHPSVDESALIDRTTEHLRLSSTRITVRSGSVLRGMVQYMQRWQLPPSSPNMFFWLPLFERASALGTRTMLDGEGGDELFGFAPYLLADRLRHGRVLSAVQLIVRTPGSAGSLSRKRVTWMLRHFGIKGALPPLAAGIRRRVRGPEAYGPAWMRPETTRLWHPTETERYWKRLPGPRWWASQVYGITQSLGPSLVYEQSRRRAGMYGIEPRHPLVDVDLIELALRVPPELNFDPRFSRPLLREAVAGMLPDEVRLRPRKSNFDAVFHASLAGADLPAVAQILSAPDAELAAYVDLDAVRRQLLDPLPPADPRGRQHWALQVWRLVTAECWLRAQTDPSYLDRLDSSENLVTADYDIAAVPAPSRRD